VAVYSLHDSPVFFGASQGIMLTLFIIGFASIIAYKTQRYGLALTIGVVLAGFAALNFANVQATMVLNGDQIVVQNLISGEYRVRKDDVVSMAQFRRRGGGTALVLTTRSGQECGIVVAGNRRPQLEEVLVKELGLTAEPSSGDLKRWSRRS
jgi:hypothetical protein